MLKILIKKSIYLYKIFLSPLLPPACRYYPSCSEYAMEAVEEHGPFHGAVLSLKRIFRCHPFRDGGYDPVPPATAAPAALDRHRRLN